MIFPDTFQKWLHQLIQGYIIQKVVIKETWEVEKVEHKGVYLPHVLLENKSIIINKFYIPIKILSIQLAIWNKNVVVGSVQYKGPLSIPPRRKRHLTMDIRLSHVTAVFNLLRFMLTDTIYMDVRGQINIKVLWMEFILPVQDSIAVPREKFSMTMTGLDVPSKKNT